ncbi:MAG: DUF1080 domain-containing protein [Verrucomicrobiota bacterium]|nr:DUF1080 domain-containing protein [Verrucomicrobiota bacterium]
MKSFRPLSHRAAVLAIAGLFTICTALSAVAGSELEPIFNGRDLTGWKVPEPNPYWKVVEGVLVGESDEKLKGSLLYTEKSYRDLIVETDVRWNGEIDSGINVRTPSIHLQFGVSRSLKRDMTCSFYVGKYPESGQARNIDKLLKPGDWNTIRLQAKGDTFTVWLNGEKVSEYTDPKYSGPGPIGLQVHGGLKMKVEFRNIRAKALD